MLCAAGELTSSASPDSELWLSKRYDAALENRFLQLEPCFPFIELRKYLVTTYCLSGSPCKLGQHLD